MKRSFARASKSFALLIGVVALWGVAGRAATGPLNDNFANAQGISGNQGSVSGINVGATKEAGEPNHAGNAGGMSVWFRWVAPNSGTADFNTENSDFDTVLGIYTGSSVSTLTQVASGDDVSSFDKTSDAKFAAVGGRTYYIAVDGFQDPKTGNVANGHITLSYTLPPANDNFANAQILSGTSGSVNGTTFGATSESGDPQTGNTIFYRFTAPATGLLTLNASGAVISVSTGATLPTLTAIADTSGSTAQASTKEVGVRSGTTLYIELDASSGGNTTLKYNFFADATAPTVSITSPAANSFISSLRGIIGTVADNTGGTGVREVDVYLRRHSDGKYWDGMSSWVITPTPLRATLPTTGNKWSLLAAQYYPNSNYNLPNSSDLLDGGYTIQAVAYDKAGNRSTASSSVTADQTAPTGSFSPPANKALLTNLNVISGRAADKGSGVSRVDLLIQRRSDGKYWTGTTWSATPTALKTTFSAGVWTRNVGNPSGASLLNGSYNLLALIYDRALNVTRIQNQVTVHKMADVAVVAKLSMAAANAASSSLQLKFFGALDAAAASDAAHYSVTVNGHAAVVESAGYNAGTHSVTLALPEGSLRAGDAVTVTLDGVVDAHGAAVAYSETLTAH